MKLLLLEIIAGTMSCSFPKQHQIKSDYLCSEITDIIYYINKQQKHRQNTKPVTFKNVCVTESILVSLNLLFAQ